jgi:hypothetical protein
MFTQLLLVCVCVCVPKLNAFRILFLFHFLLFLSYFIPTDVGFNILRLFLFQGIIEAEIKYY